MNMNACFLCEHFAMSLVGGISSIRWYELASSIVVGVGSIKNQWSMPTIDREARDLRFNLRSKQGSLGKSQNVFNKILVQLISESTLVPLR